jgi:hypothetical protein
VAGAVGKGWLTHNLAGTRDLHGFTRLRHLGDANQNVPAASLTPRLAQRFWAEAWNSAPGSTACA